MRAEYNIFGFPRGVFSFWSSLNMGAELVQNNAKVDDL
jgi:hypothetical protein